MCRNKNVNEAEYIVCKQTYVYKETDVTQKKMWDKNDASKQKG